MSYRWKAEHGGMGVSEARRLRELQAENGGGASQPIWYQSRKE
jgi:hypothetical protein